MSVVSDQFGNGVTVECGADLHERQCANPDCEQPFWPMVSLRANCHPEAGMVVEICRKPDEWPVLALFCAQCEQVTGAFYLAPTLPVYDARSEL